MWGRAFLQNSPPPKFLDKAFLHQLTHDGSPDLHSLFGDPNFSTTSNVPNVKMNANSPTEPVSLAPEVLSFSSVVFLSAIPEAYCGSPIIHKMTKYCLFCIKFVFTKLAQVETSAYNFGGKKWYFKYMNRTEVAPGVQRT